MGLMEIALGNLRRTPGRTAFLVALVALAAATVTGTATLTATLHREVGDAFDRTGANVLILPRGDRRFSYAGVAVPAAALEEQNLPEAWVDLVLTIPNRESIAVVAPKLLSVVPAGDGPVMAVGVRFPSELRLKPWWRVRIARADASGRLPAGAYAPARPPLSVTPAQVLLGSRVARMWGKDVGDTAVIAGRSFTVAGVLDAVGSDEDDVVWMDLATLQALTGKEGLVTFVELAALCNSCPIDEIVAQLSSTLPGARVTAVREAVAARRAVVDRFGRFTLGMAATVAAFVFVAAALVLTTGARERTRQIGVLGALGFARRQVLFLLYAEAGAVGLAGGLAGCLLGLGLARAGGPALGLGAAVNTPPALLGAAATGSVLTTLLASSVAAWQATRLDPARALRFF